MIIMQKSALPFFRESAAYSLLQHTRQKRLEPFGLRRAEHLFGIAVFADYALIHKHHFAESVSISVRISFIVIIDKDSDSMVKETLLIF